MAASFFFYDLETSGINPRSARVMQFAGQRTDMDLKPIGEPVNLLIKLTPDTLPEPDAIMLTGITPQSTISEGLTEADFLQEFYDTVVIPDTIFVGYNSVRFDDEFMRFLHYRNFYDPYEWQWANGCSRWDLLDVVRMTRALRPDDIEWPFAPDGRPTNRLEMVAKVNNLAHDHAHDALSDVMATIAVAELIKTKQPDLFKYLLECRNKKVVSELVLKGLPFVYSTGKYPSENLHTSVAVLLTKHPQHDSAIVYDLRHDPTPFLKMSVDELVEAWKWHPKEDIEHVKLPVKTLKYNRCPAVAPLGVIKESTTQERLNLSLDTIAKHLKILSVNQTAFVQKILDTQSQLDKDREQTSLVDNLQTVDERLYEKFIDGTDKNTIKAVRAAAPQDLSTDKFRFNDDRMSSLLPLYKARNYPSTLTGEEREAWDLFCRNQLFEGGQTSKLARYFKRLQELAAGKLTSEQEYLLEELQLYGQSIMPAELDQED